MFLSDDIIEDIVIFTNSYADIIKETPEIIDRIQATNRSLFKLWKPVTVNEMWVYISVISIMGIVKKPMYHMYWSKDHMFSTPIFSRLMRRDRFEQIRKMLHFTDPLLEDLDDPLTKLSSFLDKVQANFKRIYTPSKNVAVDEYLSLWKGRLKFRVYIPNKRERYGVKIYMLCESSSAYLYSFIIYAGADTKYVDPGVQFPKPFHDYPTYSQVVLSLMQGLFNQGYSVTLDNLYTEPSLLLALFKNSTDCFGTLRKKKGLPKDFWDWKPAKGVGIPPLIKFCDQKLMVMRWNDCYKTKSKKIVSMMSTKHTGEIVATGKIHFSSKQEIMKPDVIKDYNSTMGGVDTLSRVITPYSVQRKGLKWYRKIGELFFDVCIYNSYVVWKKVNKSGISHLAYRQMLIKTIVMIHLQEKAPDQPGRGEPINNLHKPLRLVERHFPSVKPHTKGRSKRSRCIRCNQMGVRKDVTLECRKCEVSLCITPCFEMYHTHHHFEIAEQYSSSSSEDSID